MRISRITLGTVQLGMDYGISNAAGRPSDSDTALILDLAAARGITCLDTAPAYGDAEVRIGNWVRAGRVPPAIVSKLPRISFDDDDVDQAVSECLQASLATLGAARLDAYLCHGDTDLFRPSVVAALRRQVDRGLIGGFGVSCYTPERLEALLDQVPDLAAVQVPFNLFNTAFQDSGVLDRCAERGVTVFARSAYVQGLIFMDPDALPRHLAPVAVPLKRLRALQDEAGVSMDAMAVAAVAAQPAITSVVIGVAGPAQVPPSGDAPVVDSAVLKQAFELCSGMPETLVDPRFWPR